MRCHPYLLLPLLIWGCSDNKGQTPVPDGPPVGDSRLLFPDGPGADGGEHDLPATEGPLADGPAADLAPPDLPQPLQVTCDGSPKEGPPPLQVAFTSQVSGGSGSPSFAWDFGDGTNDTAAQPAHTYNDVGAFSAALSVTSGAETQGCSVQLAVTLDVQVVVPGGGGSAQVSFSSLQGQTLSVTLTAADSSLVPYAYLEAPDSSGAYLPDIGTAQGGSNSGQLTLTQSGGYVLTVFDAASTGGTIQVVVGPI
jgi:hypothetical protein